MDIAIESGLQTCLEPAMSGTLFVESLPLLKHVEVYFFDVQ